MGDTNQNQDVMDNVKEYGQAVLNNPKTNHQIHLLNVIGEIEGKDAPIYPSIHKNRYRTLMVLSIEYSICHILYNYLHLTFPKKEHHCNV